MRNSFALLSLILICSCSGYEYVSNPHYVPLNNQKNDWKISAGKGNCQVGYFITDHITIFSTGYYRNTKGLNNWDDIFTSNNEENNGRVHREDEIYNINLGGGYVTKLGPAIFGILGSAGFGGIDYYHTQDLVNDYKFEQFGNNYNIYIQPVIGLNVKDHFEFGFSPKFIRLTYYNLRSTLEMGDNKDDVSQDMYLAGRKRADMYFFEPGLTLRAGGKNIKAEMQFVPAFNFADTKQIRYRDFGVFFGIYFNLGRETKAEVKNSYL